MKKSLCLLLALLLLCSCGTVFAEAADAAVFEEPILFRGIPWGSDLPAALAALPAEANMSRPSEYSYWYKFDDAMYNESSWDNFFNAPLGISTRSWADGVKVAGYEIDEMDLYFVYLPGDDGLPVRDEAHTALNYAYYRLAPKDPAAMYADLLAKLSSVYGDVDFSRTEETYVTFEQNMWYGEDGTAVSLVRESHSGGSEYIFIKYGFRGGDELLENAYKAIVLEESVNAGSSVDGL